MTVKDKQQLVVKDTPLAEITLRKYEHPSTSTNRELVRKLCLSVGLLQPGDSRDVIVDVFQALLASKEPLTSKEVEIAVIDKRRELNIPLLGIASSNIRRQLLRLRELFFIEKVANKYRVNENCKLSELFVEKVEKYYLSAIVERVKEYLDQVDKEFSR